MDKGKGGIKKKWEKWREKKRGWKEKREGNKKLSWASNNQKRQQKKFFNFFLTKKTTKLTFCLKNKTFTHKKWFKNALFRTIIHEICGVLGIVRLGLSETAMKIVLSIFQICSSLDIIDFFHSIIFMIFILQDC